MNSSILFFWCWMSFWDPAPAFTMKDLSGKTVSLADYRGKVVVIDFWATWCVPCRESFPAINRVLDKYKGDASVVFLFVDTRERVGDPVGLIRRFLSENHYPFRVILDPPGEPNYKAFGMAGIPTRFIIDGRGLVRYKLEGYDPRLTDEQAAAGLSRLIETSRR